MKSLLTVDQAGIKAGLTSSPIAAGAHNDKKRQHLIRAMFQRHFDVPTYDADQALVSECLIPL